MKKNILLEQLNHSDKFLKTLEEKIALSRDEVKEALKNVDELTELMKNTSEQ